MSWKTELQNTAIDYLINAHALLVPSQYETVSKEIVWLAIKNKFTVYEAFKYWLQSKDYAHSYAKFLEENWEVKKS